MFLPENIDLAHSEKYNLSIRLAPNGFSFCIYCPNDPSIYYFQEIKPGNKLSYIENVQKLIFDFGFFSQAFRKTMVTLVSPHFTLVPDAFFEKKRAKEVFDFNFHEINGIILSDTCGKGDFHTVFCMDETLHSFLSRNLWNPRFGHHISSLLTLFTPYKPIEGQNRCFVDFHDESLSVICFSGGQLLSANTFAGNNPHDVSYFIASVWEKHSFSQMADTLYLSGNIEWQKTAVDTLKKLIRNVETVSLKPKVMLTEEQLKSIPTHLLAALCE